MIELSDQTVCGRIQRRAAAVEARALWERYGALCVDLCVGKPWLPWDRKLNTVETEINHDHGGDSLASVFRHPYGWTGAHEPLVDRNVAGE